MKKFEKNGLLLQSHSVNQNAPDNKMPPPFGEEGCSPNENAGFPVTANTTCNRSNENVGFLDIAKQHAEEECCSANENAEFPDTAKTTCYQSTTQC